MRPELSAGGERSLRNFLGELVWRHFFEDVRLEEPRVTTYVASLLADFARTENLYRIRAASFDRERELRKHVGDYTLFMTGLFPESVAKARRTRHPCRDAFIDFVQAGKESYAIVSSFNQFEYKAEAPLFRRLSENFELCVVGLNLVKQDLEEFQRESYQRLKRAVDDLPG